ncbi:hypothetical protein DFP72DRAFT_1162320 [Ephemerocybe angulata]|uniref:F-box domain-containing protein n=1 Tax=Ephemerocybe angulata TaxID=980116 RepID=A0A8H6MDI8_9AGAR|nr:hypothetical protein DFP72DRAFT_1162320 [Tulosesus angulatus]
MCLSFLHQRRSRSRRLQPKCITGTPSEVWHEIFVRLGAQDVLSSSRTCKHLLEVALDEHLWRRLVLNMCQEYDLFLPSYPISEMSLVQLQRAALTPDLFTRRMHKQGRPTHLPLSEAFTPVSSSMRTIRSAPTVQLYDHLVPGGRFWVTILTGELQTEVTCQAMLEVWDLGPPGSSPRQSPSLTSKGQDLGCVSALRGGVTCAVAIGRLEETLNIAVGIRRGDAVPYTVSIYAIAPGMLNPSLEVIASINILAAGDGFHHLSALSLSEGRAIISINLSFVIWDFSEAAYIVLPHGLRSIRQTKIIENTLVTISEEAGVHQWHLSEWKSVSQDCGLRVDIGSNFHPLTSDRSIPPLWDAVDNHSLVTRPESASLMTVDLIRVHDNTFFGHTYCLTTTSRQNSADRAPYLQLTLGATYPICSSGDWHPLSTMGNPRLGFWMIDIAVSRSGYADLVRSTPPGQDVPSFINLLCWIQPSKPDKAPKQQDSRRKEVLTELRFALLHRYHVTASWCPASARFISYAGEGRRSPSPVVLVDYLW